MTSNIKHMALYKYSRLQIPLKSDTKYSQGTDEHQPLGNILGTRNSG